MKLRFLIICSFLIKNMVAMDEPNISPMRITYHNKRTILNKLAQLKSENKKILVARYEQVVSAMEEEDVSSDLMSVAAREPSLFTSNFRDTGGSFLLLGTDDICRVNDLGRLYDELNLVTRIASTISGH